MKYRGPISLFCMCLPSFHNPTCSTNCLSLESVSLAFFSNISDCICSDFFLGVLFCSIFLYVCFIMPEPCFLHYWRLAPSFDRILKLLCLFWFLLVTRLTTRNLSFVFQNWIVLLKSVFYPLPTERGLFSKCTPSLPKISHWGTWNHTQVVWVCH